MCAYQIFRQFSESWRGRVVRLSAASMAMLLLAPLKGCAVLTSELPETLRADGRSPVGVHYYLPKGMLTLTLAVNKDTGSFRLTPDQIKFIADPNQRYYLRYQPLPQYADTVTVQVYPQRGFLKSITANTTDQTPQAIVSLTSALVALRADLEAATSAPNEQRLAALTIDPTDESELSRAEETFNNAVRAFATQFAAARCNPHTESGIILDVSKRALCDNYRQLSNLGPDQRYVALFFEKVEPQDLRREVGKSVCRPVRKYTRANRVWPSKARGTALASTDPTVATKADCSVGLCYRPPEVYQFCMSVGTTGVRQVMLIPNKAPLVAIDIHRAFFVNKVQNITFDSDGLLTSFKLTKDSELQAIAMLPVNVFDSVSTGLQLRIKIIDQQINEAKTTKELLETRAELEKQRALLEAAYAGRGARTSTISVSPLPQLASPASTAAPQAGKFLDRWDTAQ